MKLFITAIGTDSGKTLVSSILCEALQADYWKPMQTGPAPTDADMVKYLVSFPIVVHPETHYFKNPVSPHLASQMEGKTVGLSDFVLPVTSRHLVVEGAGGVLVPLNEKGDFVIDIAKRFQLEIVLVIRLYLGCINHALLSIHELRSRGQAIKGLVFSGEDKWGAISLITTLSKLPILLHIQEEESISNETVKSYSSFLQSWAQDE